jgi:hypothetical protein
MLAVQNSLLQHQSSEHTHTHTHALRFSSSSSAKQCHADWCAVWRCRAGGGLASSSCLTEPFIFIVLTEPFIFIVLTFLMFVAHSSLALMRLSSQISASILSLFPVAAAVSNWPLWGLSPVSYSQLLKWCTQHLAELSMASPPYTVLRLPWISYCNGAFHSKK